MVIIYYYLPAYDGVHNVINVAPRDAKCSLYGGMNMKSLKLLESRLNENTVRAASQSTMGRWIRNILILVARLHLTAAYDSWVDRPAAYGSWVDRRNIYCAAYAAYVKTMS